MRRLCLWVFVAVCVLAASSACLASPAVSNVTAHQRTDGSRIVDIYYDLADPGTANLFVSVQVSGDGGSTYTVTASSLSGDVGSTVSTGTGKHIIWNAGTDLSGAYGTNYKVAITASDSAYTGQMIYIPAGSFLMGNSGVGDDATYDYYWELPQHSVTLSAYYIGKYDVTRGQYQQFMNAGGYFNPAYWSSGGWNWVLETGATQPQYWAAVQNWGTGNFTQTDSYPVVGVTYYEAEAFCNWAGGRLPTEAQWERAARWTGSHPNVYPWGDVWDAEKCNNYYDHNSAGGGYEACQTSPVGSYPSGASPCGCMDMAGNVWQWCQDWYKSYPGSSSPFDYTNSYRVPRGGGWLNYIYYLDYRCACRDFGSPYDLYVDYGFRLAR